MTAVDDAAFRAALGRFASGVTVVSTNVDGVDHAMTASAFTSVSLTPPRVLVCVDHRNRFHQAVSNAGFWAVSILAEQNEDASTWFAHRGRPLEDQFADIPSRPAVAVNARLVDGALAWLECETWRTYDGIDHSIMVGTVCHAEVNESLDDPLLYYRSHYGSLVRKPRSEHDEPPPETTD